MTTYRSKLRLLHYGLIALVTVSMCVIIKVEYFDSRPVRSSAARPGDEIILVKRQPLYVTRLQARERRLAIATLFIGALASVAAGLHLRSERAVTKEPWKKNSGYSS
jgi:hypothetical protein